MEVYNLLRALIGGCQIGIRNCRCWCRWLGKLRHIPIFKSYHLVILLVEKVSNDSCNLPSTHNIPHFSSKYFLKSKRLTWYKVKYLLPLIHTAHTLDFLVLRQSVVSLYVTDNWNQYFIDHECKVVSCYRWQMRFRLQKRKKFIAVNIILQLYTIFYSFGVQRNFVSLLLAAWWTAVIELF